MVLVICLVVLVVGLLVFVLSVKPDIKEIGRIMFAFGLLTFLLRLAPETFNVFK
jgi:Na+/phosphate symporter